MINMEAGPIYLHNELTNATLRVSPNGMNLQGNGGWGKWGKFVVKPASNGCIRLAAWTHRNNHIKIGKMGVTSCTGGMGKWSLLRPQKGRAGVPGEICLASFMKPQSHVGVLPDKKMKPAHLTGKGKNGRFNVVSGWMKPGSCIHLQHMVSGKNVAFTNGHVHCHGGKGKWAKWIVTNPKPIHPQLVQLRHFVFKNKFLNLNANGKVHMGNGGKWCTFWARASGGKRINLRSTAHMGKAGVGFQGKFGANGFQIGMGKLGTFVVHHWM